MKKVWNISCICIAIIILISSLMTGCSSKSNKINTEQSSASYVENEDFQYFIDSSSAIAKADNGYYFLNSLKLYFFDTATKEAYIVCNKPNCEHTSSKCTAFFPAFNYYPFQLSYFNNKLYVLGWEEEGSNMRHNYIYEVSLDNFKRKKSTYLFDGTDTSSVSFIIHRGYIYYLKGGGANIKETTACLFRKKIGSKSKKDKAEVIYKFSGIGAELSNIKASGNNLILMNSSFSDTDGNGYKTIANATPAGSSGGYISSMKTEAFGRLPVNASGSSSTYEADGMWYNNSQVNYAFVGGSWGYALLVGPFYAYLHDAASYSYSSIGAALSCKPLAAA